MLDFLSEDSKVVVYSITDDRIIFEKQSNIETRVASLTKIMTSLIFIENYDLDEEVLITSEMVEGLEDFAVIGLVPGQKVLARDLVFATMLPSAGDAAQALAISCFGSVESFVEKMNERVEKLELEHTHFSNVVGKDEDNYSSANDILIILKEALRNDTFKEVFNTFSYDAQTIGKRLIKTFEKNDYFLGGKTGFTYQAGRSLATLGQTKDNEIIVVDLNEDWQSSDHILNSERIYNFFDENYSLKKILTTGDELFEFQVNDSEQKSLKFFSKETKELFLANDPSLYSLNYEYSGKTTIDHHDKIGDYLGTYIISLDDTVVYSQDIFLEEKINFYNYTLWNCCAGIFFGFLIIILIIRIKRRFSRS